MKTFFIWNEFEVGLKLGSVDYDASHLNDKFINLEGTSDAESDELNELQTKATWYGTPIEWVKAAAEALSADDVHSVIECGFAP